MTANTALLAGGVLHILWALFHLAFPRLFRWDTTLSGLDRVNAAIMRVMNLCLACAFLANAWLSLSFAPELSSTPLGRGVCAALAGFWGFRLILQNTLFRPLAPRSLALSPVIAATAAAYALPFFIA